MKIKTVFLAFNIIIVVSFLFVFFMPAFFLGWSVSGAFWRENWYVAVVFVAVLAVLNGYFAASWKLFGALEKQDWPRVVELLERRIFENGRVTVSNARLLANGYLLMSRTTDVLRLEEHLRTNNQRVLRSLVLLFGVPHLLANDGADIQGYYAAFRDIARGTKREWIDWHIGFAQLLQEEVEDGAATLRGLVESCRDDLVAALALHLVLPLEQDEERRETLEARRAKIRAKYGGDAWNRMVQRRSDELHVLVLSRLFDDVRQTIFA